jgi:uncharacterized protein YbaR (Trm112 family)
LNEEAVIIMHLKKKLDIPKNGLVLEIGGGSAPHPRSDILIDRFLDSEEGFSQRGRAPLVVGNRVLIQADGKLMPFKDDQFEYVILSHVIEHIPENDIHKFVAEVQRVARSGYIEAPSIVYEAIRDIPEHVWNVVCEPGVIHLCKKNFVCCLQPFLAPLFDDEDFCAVVERHADLFFTGVEWQDSVEIEIHQGLDSLISLYPPNWAMRIIQDDLDQLRHAQYLARHKNLVKKMVPPILFDWRRSIIQGVLGKSPALTSKSSILNWHDLVVCPVCHSALSFDNEKRSILCQGCQRKYPIREDGIPSFVVEEEQLKSQLKELG